MKSISYISQVLLEFPTFSPGRYNCMNLSLSVGKVYACIVSLQALHTLHAMYHEVGGAGGAGSDLRELLALAGELCRSLRCCRDCKEARSALHACKDWPEALRRLATLLNTYNPPDIRDLAIGNATNNTIQHHFGITSENQQLYRHPKCQTNVGELAGFTGRGLSIMCWRWKRLPTSCVVGRLREAHLTSPASLCRPIALQCGGRDGCACAYLC